MFDNLILVFRADPVICGHSTEGRNLAESAKELGFQNIHIVTYPVSLLEASNLPLKKTINPYSKGITVHRPNVIGDYKILDGRVIHAMTAKIIDLLNLMKGNVIVMDLYLVPHGKIVMDAVQVVRRYKKDLKIVTIAEAVGSDITSQIYNCLRSGSYGAIQSILENYLDHDIQLAVSNFTKELMLELVHKVDKQIETCYEERLREKCKISYPAIHAKEFLSIGTKQEENQEFLKKYGLQNDKFLLYLSRITESKGLNELLEAYYSSLFKKDGNIPLVICGKGPYLNELKSNHPASSSLIYIEDVSDLEKKYFFYNCSAFIFPSKPTDTFIETFGIVITEKMLCGGNGIVITTKTGGIPEASGIWCLSSEECSTKSLLKEMDYCYQLLEEERKILAKNAQEFAKQFDRKIIFSKILEMASNVIHM
jgi:glycosyltransferase involved in cell wall biosynthesis